MHTVLAVPWRVNLTLREAAPLLGRSVRALRTRIARGEIRARKVGDSWRIEIDDLPLSEQAAGKSAP